MLHRLFFLFLKVSTLTLGGGYAMVPVMKWELERAKLLEEEEFLKILSVAQAIPGPIAFNTAVLVGKRLKGVAGAVISGLAVVLPPFFAIVLVAEFVNTFRESVALRGFLNGVYAAVVGLVASVLYQFVKSQKWSLRKTIILATAAAVLFIKSSLVVPVVILLLVLLYSKGV